MGLPAWVKATFATSRHHAHTMIARPRPYPYDTRVTLDIIDGGAPDVYGGYTSIIPRGAYDFGDTPNCVRVEQIIMENIGANDTYVLEFYASADDVTYSDLGAIRFVRTAPFTRSFEVEQNLHCLMIDTETLYARLKDALGGTTTVSFSLLISRHLPIVPGIPMSPGPWPTG